MVIIKKQIQFRLLREKKSFNKIPPNLDYFISKAGFKLSVLIWFKEGVDLMGSLFLGRSRDNCMLDFNGVRSWMLHTRLHSNNF
jgi:hypothetical protein